MVPSSSESPTTTAKVLDGAAIVQMLPPRHGCKTFQDYAEKVFRPYILQQLGTVERLDVIWDRYKHDSLKAGTRQKRGKGDRINIKNSTPLPTNWISFLRVDANKEALFSLLGQSIMEGLDSEKLVVTTQDDSVITSRETDASSLMPCDHEEADTRMLLHVYDCVRKGHSSVLIRTVDTDVVVLAIAAVRKMPIKHLWVAFGTGAHFRFIPAHDIAASLGEEISECLPFFHAFTGCDTVSGFAGIGKKTAWEVWKGFPKVNTTFRTLAAGPAEINPVDMDILEQFVVLLYDKSCTSPSVNSARMKLFAKGRPLERIPPTHAALVQHTKRAVLQGGYCWGRTLNTTQDLPDPAQWGWRLSEDGQWSPFWSELPEAADICKELIHCGCKKACKLPCKCCRAGLPCTELCVCSGTCHRDDI